MSIRIIDIFVRLREVLSNHQEIRIEIEEIKKKLNIQNGNIEIVFKYLDELMEKKGINAKCCGAGVKNITLFFSTN